MNQTLKFHNQIIRLSMNEENDSKLFIKEKAKIKNMKKLRRRGLTIKRA